jgi:hypothetical protein
MELVPSQKAALSHITRYARDRKEAAQRTLQEVLRMSNISPESFDEAIAKLKAHARVALHFHPDRPTTNLTTVAESLAECGIYKSQFETLLSNGSVSAFPGGARDLWERKIFGGAYQLEGTLAAHRPKYGALDLLQHAEGPAPRFGSCYFLLRPEVSGRSTFTYLDSHQDPPEKGTYEEFDDIVAALFTEAFLRDFAIGEKELTPSRLLLHLRSNLDKPFLDPADKTPVRNLNHYIEAQVHGELSLANHVEILVADPAFRGTRTGTALEQMCQRYRITLHWHMGFALSVDEVPSDFRGPAMPPLARRIAKRETIDASCIGEAAMELKRNPAAFADRGSYEEVLQELKLLWHVLVKYGKPLRCFAA